VGNLTYCFAETEKLTMFYSGT